MKTLTFLSICICLAIPCSAIDDPVAHWKLDEMSGDIAYDSVGNNDGTLVGDPVWTDGQIDGAIEFDGVGDYINLGTSSILNSYSNFTISAWVHPRSVGEGSGDIFDKSTGLAGHDGFSLDSGTTNNTFRFNINNGTVRVSGNNAMPYSA